MDKYFFTLVLYFVTSSWLQAQFTINSYFGNLNDCDTLSRGIYLVWWDNDFDLEEEASLMLDSMMVYRQSCLNELNMEDPPNPQDGYYYNVYIHTSGDIFPDGWGNGQGTDPNGYPYLTLPIGAHLDWVNVAHETFHIFQYSANSPGFAYSGDSQWYIEASANWFAAIRNKTFAGNFLEAESLVRLPHVALWLSFDNFPDDYPQNWQRYVHQYAMALLLVYLTEEAGVSHNVITEGLFSGTTALPQEYYFNTLGGAVFRDHFIDWAAHITNHFDFLTSAQIDVLENEWNTYADPEDDNEFIQIYQDTGSNGWFRPADSLMTTGWSFNTYKVLNASNTTYTFELNGDATGSDGDLAFFQGKVLVKNEEETAFYDLEMLNDLEGSLIIDVNQEDTELYFIIAAMPEVFEDVEQVYRYDMKIEKGTTVAIDELTEPAAPSEVGRFNLLGQPVEADYPGVQIILFSDGTVLKQFQIRMR